MNENNTTPCPAFPGAVLTGGWVCPVCGRGVAPTATVCPCRPIPAVLVPFVHPYPWGLYPRPSPMITYSTGGTPATSGTCP